jgi:hypothetical protein
MSFDIQILETLNGGDSWIRGNDLATTQGYESMVYQALFCGDGNWWGNKLLVNEDESVFFKCETEQLLKKVALNSAGRVQLEQAAKRDLSFFERILGATVTVSVVIESDDRVRFDVGIDSEEVSVHWNKAGDITSYMPYVPPPLTASVVLFPRMEYSAQTTGDPHAIGHWMFQLEDNGTFINAYDLVDDYLTDCEVIALTEDAYVSGGTPVTITPTSLPPQSSKAVRWRVDWNHPPQGFGYLLVWSDVTTSTPTITYKDVNNNVAYVSPLLIIDNLSQDLIQYMLADVVIETVSATAEQVVVRVTRSHPPIFLADFSDHTMSWKGTMAPFLMDDPDNPGNPDIQIATLPAGKYTIGVRTVYTLTSISVTYPPSEFTAVVEIF